MIMLGEFAIRGAQLLFLVEEWRGTPAWRGRMHKGEELRAGFAKKVASLQFPDVQSCLAKDGSNSWEIDWQKIDNSRQADVCLYRILHDADDLGEAAERLRAQGFGVNENSLILEGGDTPTRRLDGYWSIRKHGPRFDSMRAFTYFLSEVYHTLAVRTHCHENEDRLVFVDVGYIMN